MEYMEQQMQTFIEAGISNAEQCYVRIAELEEKNAALAAQVEALQSRVGVAERVEAIFNEAQELSFDDCVKLFPDEIRQVRADAAVDFASNLPSLAYMKSEILIEANQYHASILAGKE